ncbi:MAG: hydrogenase maturation protease [Candidatus Thorarchaeota archaeon]
MSELYKKLKSKLEGAKRVAFVGVGEEKLSDDGVGPYVISEFLSLSDNKFLFINAGVSPMSRIEEIIDFKATHLVLLDTCNLNKPPGTVAIIERENIKEFVPISTHTIPLHVVVDLLLDKIPNLNVFMIGFVPESLNGFTELKFYKQNEFTLDERNENQDLPFFEFQLTETIKKVANQIIEIIKKIIHNK